MYDENRGISTPYMTGSATLVSNSFFKQDSLLELLGLAHMEFQINLKGLFRHGVRQLFSTTLPVDVEESLLK
jgi:hypothetical protein